ncbi:MAG: thioredoxin [Lachnospiraceae bacterium]|nr:thioredoxin [Lachnospiraceae bacterium]
MAVGILLVITGVILKQPSAVLAKAIRICMECIGLG